MSGLDRADLGRALEREVTPAERDRVRVEMLQRFCREGVEALERRRATLRGFETGIPAPEVDQLFVRAGRQLLDAIDELVVVDRDLRELARLQEVRS